jgi:hypothetical protein
LEDQIRQAHAADWGSMRSRSLARTFLLIGVGLLLLSFVAMNLRPFAFSDMRVFDWVAVNGILTVIGAAFVLGALVLRLLRHSDSC